MGEIADDHIDRMIEEGYYPGFLCSRGRKHPQIDNLPKNKKKKKHKEPEKPFIPATNYHQKRKEPHEKKFDMSWFPETPKPLAPEPEKSPWEIDGEEAPF